MGMQDYIDQMKELQSILIEFLENPNATEQDVQNLLIFISDHKYEENREELKNLFQLLLNISNYYHRTPNFIKNVKDILLCLKELIKRTFTNNEIFKLFKSSKLILLFLVQSKILLLDETIIQYIKKSDTYKSDYCHFFYPEIKETIDQITKERIEKVLFEYDSNILKNFEEKRLIGENDSYICSLIRDDKVEEFIIHVNRTNIHLSSTIPYSIFETNLFLIENQNTTLIEYAAFYGSIQIFQYLRFNNVELLPSIWIFAIHSKNAELIHLLEDNQVELPDNFLCLLEAIKCHHNDIANYIKQNLIDPKINDSNRNDLITSVFESAVRNGDSLIIYYLLSIQKKIDNGAFIEKKNELNIAIPPTITIINNSAFSDCYGLKQVIIPTSVTTIKFDAFSCCKKLTEIVIPFSVKVIDDRVFSECTSLKRIEFEFPSSLTKIGVYTFDRCISLKQIVIPSSIKLIEENAFALCDSLEQFEIPSSLEVISKGTFYYCKSLQKVSFEFPSSLTSIKRSAFLNCSSLTSIELPDSVTSIDESAFEACSSLKEIVIPPSVSIISSYMLRSCKSLIKVTIPPSVIKISDCAFYGCSSLVQIFLPSSLKSIERWAFRGCSSLKQITIPTSVDFIGNNAFVDCSSLEKMTVSSILDISNIGLRNTKIKRI